MHIDWMEKIRNASSLEELSILVRAFACNVASKSLVFSHAEVSQEVHKLDRVADRILKMDSLEYAHYVLQNDHNIY